MEPEALSVAEALVVAIGAHQTGDLDGAEAAYHQILGRDPRHADALHLLGVVDHQRGRHQMAVERISQAISIAGDRADYYSNLGVVLKGLGRLDEAVAAYGKALSLWPD